jgi:uncharacterized coiled-coil protein SlyX
MFSLIDLIMSSLAFAIGALAIFSVLAGELVNGVSLLLLLAMALTIVKWIEWKHDARLKALEQQLADTEVKLAEQADLIQEQETKLERETARLSWVVKQINPGLTKEMADDLLSRMKTSLDHQ